jgi:hypothetical protein
MAPLSCVTKKDVSMVSFYHNRKNKSTPFNFHSDTNKGAFLYASREIYSPAIGGSGKVEAGRFG